VIKSWLTATVRLNEKNEKQVKAKVDRLLVSKTPADVKALREIKLKAHPFNDYLQGLPLVVSIAASILQKLPLAEVFTKFVEYGEEIGVGVKENKANVSESMIFNIGIFIRGCVFKGGRGGQKAEVYFRNNRKKSRFRSGLESKLQAL